MSATYLMSWESESSRWVKMHNGFRYRITCAELKVPPTKQESYLAANEWWREKLIEIGPKKRKEIIPRPDQEEAINEMNNRIEYARRFRPALLKALEKRKDEILHEDDSYLHNVDDDQINGALTLLKMAGWERPKQLDPVVLKILFGKQELWDERYRQANINVVENQISSSIDRYLETIRVKLKPASFYEIQNYFNRLLEDECVFTRTTCAASLNEKTVSSHFDWLIKKGYQYQTHNKYLGFFRSFIKWIYTENILETLPRNLNERKHRKKRIHKEIKRYSNLIDVIRSLPDQQKLWALLALNCGMTAADIGQTSWEQIDQDHWVLTRRRVKTGDNESTPTVRYRLWRETIQLLKKVGSRKGLIFQTNNGKPMYCCWYENGKMKKKDLLSSYWQRLNPKPAISLGKFKSVAATELKKKAVLRSYVDYFLGHAASKLSDIHYSAEIDEPFFEALAFIRRELKIPCIFPKKSKIILQSSKQI